VPDGAYAGRPRLNPCLRPFWDANIDPASGKQYRNRVLYGGRASSKTWDACGRLIYMADNARLRVCCCRQFQNKLSESVQPVLVDTIDRFGLGRRFVAHEAKIVNKATKSEFLFYGIWRQIREIKGLEGIDVFLIEEAEALTEEQWLVIEATARKRGAQLWIIFNPYLATDFVYEHFVLNPPPRTLVRLINYEENPFLAPDFLETILELKARDFEEYQHIYLGVPKTDEESSVIKRSWLMAAVDAHLALKVEPKGARRIGFDVADEGKDLNAQVFGHGPLVSWSEQWKGGEDELLKSCTRVYREATNRGAHIVYDSIGVGAMAGAKFGELNLANHLHPPALEPDYAKFITYSKFNAGAGVWRPDAKYARTTTQNKDQFANLKAQTWWLVADRCRNTYNAVRKAEKFKEDEIISFASDTPNLQKLIAELSTPKRDFDQNGRVKVESKKDLLKREVPSPNLADACVSIFAPGLDPMRISAAAIAGA
jgi:phage terminase large subunit